VGAKLPFDVDRNKVGYGSDVHGYAAFTKFGNL